MKRTLLTVSVALMSCLLMLPQAEARGRHNGTTHRSEASGRAPSGNRRPGSDSGYRPEHSPGTRPDNRPGHRPGGDVRPPQQPGHSQGQRPGYRPGRPTAPPPPPARPPGRPSYGHHHHRPPVVAPPTRPGRPVGIPWSRPVPPPGWSPSYRGNLVSGLMGLTFGLTVNAVLDNLFTSGYSVDGYNGQEVYLRGVNEFGYYWDDATLFFSGNALVRSQFYDSSVAYNATRYSNLFNSLTLTYGAPVSYNNDSRGSMRATWFGNGGDYITLEYTLSNTAGGFRYFTVLTVGR